jgi:hypothetical protein
LEEQHRLVQGGLMGRQPKGNSSLQQIRSTSAAQMLEQVAVLVMELVPGWGLVMIQRPGQPKQVVVGRPKPSPAQVLEVLPMPGVVQAQRPERQMRRAFEERPIPSLGEELEVVEGQ